MFSIEAPGMGVLKSTKNMASKERSSLITYIKGSIAELKKVSWPTRSETWNKSLIVIAFSIAFAAFLGGLDYIFNALLQVLI